MKRPGRPAPAGAERREVILAAAARCFGRYGVVKTTLDDIAAEAGLSRATTYRAIPGGRDEIVLEVLIREARTGFDALRQIIDPIETFAGLLTEGIAAAVEAIRDDPHLSMLFTAETVTTSVAIPGAWHALQLATADLLAPYTARARNTGELNPQLDDLQISEWINRLIASMVVLPGTVADDPIELRSYVSRFIAPPLLRRSLAAPPR